MYPLLLFSWFFGLIKTLELSFERASLVRSVKDLPMIKGIRPPALTSSRRVGVLSSKDREKLVDACEVYMKKYYPDEE